MSDQDEISPYNIYTVSSRWVMRIKKYINLGIITWSNTTFSELTLQELYGWQKGEWKIWSESLRVTRLMWEHKIKYHLNTLITPSARLYQKNMRAVCICINSIKKALLPCRMQIKKTARERRAMVTLKNTYQLKTSGWRRKIFGSRSWSILLCLV